jgi:hypothetical protein
VATKKRNKALDGLAKLRSSGALSATFHPDGTVASVVFGASPSPVAPPVASPANVTAEILASPLWPRTDIDALDKLPSFDGEQN